MFTTYTTTLVKKTQLVEGIYLFDFLLIKPTEINFKAGQYLIMRIPKKDGDVFRRQLSITTSQRQKNKLSLLFKLVVNGAASTYLTGLPVGGEVTFDGPAGKFTLRDNRKNKVFFATGTGIAPIRSMLYQIRNSKFEIRTFLFWGVQKVKDSYFFDEFKKMAQENKNFHFFICLSQEMNVDMVDEENRKYFILGRVNRGVEEKLFKYELRITNYEFYLCGGRTIVDSLRDYLLGKGVLQGDILFEKF